MLSCLLGRVCVRAYVCVCIRVLGSKNITCHKVPRKQARKAKCGICTNRLTGVAGDEAEAPVLGALFLG